MTEEEEVTELLREQRLKELAAEEMYKALSIAFDHICWGKRNVDEVMEVVATALNNAEDRVMYDEHVIAYNRHCLWLAMMYEPAIYFRFFP